MDIESNQIPSMTNLSQLHQFHLARSQTREVEAEVMVLPSVRANYARASLLGENGGWDSDSSSRPEDEDERTVAPLMKHTP